jgi:hypothetical protein
MRTAREDAAMKDLMFILPYRAGTLAQLTEAIG